MAGLRKTSWKTVGSCLYFALLFGVRATPLPAQQSATIQGIVQNATGEPIAAASVILKQQGASDTKQTITNAAGTFSFSALPSGVYSLTAEKGRRRSATISASDRANVKLVLPAEAAPAAAQGMEFSDKPSFTVAGVTDWTAVGGHGSDSTLRTSEELARETISLQAQQSSDRGHSSSQSEAQLRAALAAAPSSFAANQQLGDYYLHAGAFSRSLPLLEAAYQIDPGNRANEYDLVTVYTETGAVSKAREHLQTLQRGHDTADLHRLSGELDEKAGDPLSAVHELERAVRLDASEQNYFAWGSELLLHRAVWQAAEVFRDGSKAYPASARMLTALGAARFAGALYGDAAASLCAAADLSPAEPDAYTFLGRLQMAAPNPLPCAEPRLARFAQQQPANANAHYLYAMALSKRSSADPVVEAQVETLLRQAVALDPNCADAYLQLGILASARHQAQPAIDWYLRAIQANPQLGEAHYRLGVAYDRGGQGEKARYEFEQHDKIEAAEAAAVERQRREVKQFLVVLEGQAPVSTP